MKKVAVKTVEQVMKEIYESTVAVDWHGYEILVKKNLDFYEMLTFVDKVVGACFRDDGSYMPEAEDFAIRACTIALYSNVNLPSDLAKEYDVLMISGIFDLILSAINRSQFDGMVMAINSKIESIVDAGIMDSRKKLESATASMVEMLGKVNALFDGVENSDLRNIAKALESGEISEEKIVETFLNSKHEEDDA